VVTGSAVGEFDEAVEFVEGGARVDGSGGEARGFAEGSSVEEEKSGGERMDAMDWMDGLDGVGQTFDTDALGRGGEVGQEDTRVGRGEGGWTG